LGQISLESIAAIVIVREVTTLMNTGKITLVRSVLLAMVLQGSSMARSQATMSPQDRQEYLQKLQQILPTDPSFDAWLKKTNALPTDFNTLPRSNSLPDPLKFLDGHTVRTATQWPARREEIESLSQKYVWGVPAET
jgi:hypothetical protein